MAKKVNLNSKKQETLTQETTQQQPPAPTLPEVQVVPKWKPDADIVMTGSEFEALNNAIAQMHTILQVVQAVMSRHVLNGTVTLDYVKLDPKTLQYVEMTDEEKAPYIQNRDTIIQKLKEQTSK